MAVVRLDKIDKAYGAAGAALSDVSLALDPGDFCFVTGASGAGKTTLLNIIALAEEPSSGRLSLFDVDMAAADRATRSALRRRVGIVFQDLRLLDDLSAADNIGLPLRVAGVADAEIRAHVGELADWLGIGDRLAMQPEALSMAERQRVAVARAIVSRPDLLVADEPMAHVDSETALMLLHVFDQLNSFGTTVLIATHDVALARQSGRRCVRLEQGVLTNDDGIPP